MPLPNFVIAGERRSGTTSLSRWMEAHPDIYVLPALDLAYFLEDEIIHSTEWREGEADAADWERTHSPQHYAELFKEGEGKRIVGEKSADYLFWRPAHERMARFLPDAKFIFTLRDPVSRAYSHYWHAVGRGRETLSFEDALAAEDERCRDNAYARNHLSYRRRGFYDESLSDFFEHIPPERVWVVTVEGNKAAPVLRLQEVYNFLGVNPELGLEMAGTQHNANWTMVPRGWSQLPGVRQAAALHEKVVNKVGKQVAPDKESRKEFNKKAKALFNQSAAEVPMNEDTKARLRDEYAPHIEALEKLLGREFPEWKK